MRLHTWFTIRRRARKAILVCECWWGAHWADGGARHRGQRRGSWHRDLGHLWRKRLCRLLPHECRLLIHWKWNRTNSSKSGVRNVGHICFYMLNIRVYCVTAILSSLSLLPLQWSKFSSKIVFTTLQRVVKPSVRVHTVKHTDKISLKNGGYFSDLDICVLCSVVVVVFILIADFNNMYGVYWQQLTILPDFKPRQQSRTGLWCVVSKVLLFQGTQLFSGYVEIFNIGLRDVELFTLADYPLLNLLSCPGTRVWKHTMKT